MNSTPGKVTKVILFIASFEVEHAVMTLVVNDVYGSSFILILSKACIFPWER